MTEITDWKPLSNLNPSYSVIIAYKNVNAEDTFDHVYKVRCESDAIILYYVNYAVRSCIAVVPLKNIQNMIMTEKKRQLS